jgi:SAM-dependent methyltransferase
MNGGDDDHRNETVAGDGAARVGFAGVPNHPTDQKRLARSGTSATYRSRLRRRHPESDDVMKSWLDFWNAPNAIYVSRRHREAHYAKVLSGIGRFMPAGGAAVVLDWGCGDALAAKDLAQTCRTLLLYDCADSTRHRLLANYAGRQKIRVLDDAELDAVAPASLDLIVVNSVVQYLDRHQLTDALRLFHRLLKSDGKLLLGDIIAPDTPLLGHVTTFLRLAWQNGFFVAAIIGLARNFVSPYRKLRREAGYACYTEMQMLGLLDDNGFVGERLKSNIAVSQLRSSYLARKSGAESVSSSAEAMR